MLQQDMQDCWYLSCFFCLVYCLRVRQGFPLDRLKTFARKHLTSTIKCARNKHSCVYCWCLSDEEKKSFVNLKPGNGWHVAFRIGHRPDEEGEVCRRRRQDLGLDDLFLDVELALLRGRKALAAGFLQLSQQGLELAVGHRLLLTPNANL